MDDKKLYVAGHETEPYHRAKMWEIALFSLNNSASNFYLFAFGFLGFYATGVAGMATVVIASVLGLARLFDGIIDPAIGTIIDNVNTKWGRYRPIMLLSNIGLILSFIFLFNIHRMPIPTVVALFIGLIFHKIVYSFQQTVTKAAQASLTNDPEQRPLFSIFDSIFNLVVFTGGQLFVTRILFARIGAYNMEFYGNFLPLLCAISFGFTILAMFGIKRKDNPKYFGLGEEEGEKQSLKEYFSILKDNKPLKVLAFCGAMIKFAATVIGDQNFLAIFFGIIVGNYMLSGDIAAWTIIPQLAFVFLFTRFAQKKDLKFSYKSSVTIASIGLAAVIGLLLIAPDTRSLSSFSTLSIIFIVLWILAKISVQYPTSIVLTMSADITDYVTAKTGKFAPGLIGTIFSLTDSIASSLAPVVIGWIVAGIGYADGYPQPGDTLTPSIFMGGLIILGVVLASIIVTMIVIRHYPLDRKEMELIAEDIAVRKKVKEDHLNNEERTEIEIK
ncbi:MFS transporter [Anaerococcus sp. AGMB00486]|uniref:MFS transporter n=2 Tax=Anaerococcus TaxID=165779 RepID=A0ABX2NBW9_9FIRM|nr:MULTISPECIES: MFS transporter [Anaerococcus]MDY3006890.1 MFS transporter [Anaerococcus porci]MSS77783.1 glucuronide permease [Anaerococcus porci]NVF12217.1 MFS transporter [Anaerococcus faecalis]